MTRAELIEIAKRIAVEQHLDPILVCSVIEQESAWDTFAIRYEPAFFDKYVSPLNLQSPTEARARAFSFGLMQVMGQVARENGFAGKYLSALCDPEVGIAIGCKVLKRKLDRQCGDVTKGLLAYNGGSRKEYADEVLSHQSNYTA